MEEMILSMVNDNLYHNNKLIMKLRLDWFYSWNPFFWFTTYKIIDAEGYVLLRYRFDVLYFKILYKQLKKPIKMNVSYFRGGNMIVGNNIFKLRQPFLRNGRIFLNDVKIGKIEWTDYYNSKKRRLVLTLSRKIEDERCLAILMIVSYTHYLGSPSN